MHLHRRRMEGLQAGGAVDDQDNDQDRRSRNEPFSDLMQGSPFWSPQQPRPRGRQSSSPSLSMPDLDLTTGPGTVAAADTTTTPDTSTPDMPAADTPAAPAPVPDVAPAPAPAAAPAAAPAPDHGASPAMFFSNVPNADNPYGLSDNAWATDRNAIGAVTGTAPGPQPQDTTFAYSTLPSADNPYGLSDATWNTYRDAIGAVTGTAPGPAPDPLTVDQIAALRASGTLSFRTEPQGGNFARGGAVKVSKKSVHYGDGMRTRHCGICRFFILGGHCRKVEGKIDPDCWCRLYRDR